MSIGEKIGDAFDVTMNWATEGPMPWAITKFMGVIALATGIIASPFIYIGYQNAKALENRIHNLDNSITYVFNSVSDCMEQSDANQSKCKASQEEALDIAGELGTTLSYGGQTECVMKHRSCQKVTTPIIHTSTVNGITTTYTTYVTNYHPPVIAWQAAQQDLTKSVPLYQGAEEGTAVRIDGKQFQLPKMAP